MVFSKILAVLVTVTMLSAESIYGQKLFTLKKADSTFFLAIDNKYHPLDDSAVLIVYTQRNCSPCFRAVCGYVQDSLTNGPIYALHIGLENKVRAMGMISMLAKLIPCTKESLFITQETPEYLRWKPFEALPSPFLIVKQGNAFRVITYESLFGK